MEWVSFKIKARAAQSPSRIPAVPSSWWFSTYSWGGIVVWGAKAEEVFWQWGSWLNRIPLSAEQGLTTEPVVQLGASTHVDMWSSLALKKPKASVRAGSFLGDCNSGDQPAPKTQMDKEMFCMGGDRTGSGLHGFRPCFPCHLQSFFWICDVLSLLALLLMKLAISFLRLLSSHLKFIEVKSWC